MHYGKLLTHLLKATKTLANCMSDPTTNPPTYNAKALSEQIKTWALALGFQQCAISDVDLTHSEEQLNAWLSKNYHGEMSYMETHGSKRSRPAELVPGTLRSINLRMDYLKEDTPVGIDINKTLNNPQKAYIARYALGRDYHKMIRSRLQQLVQHIEKEIGEFGYRVFVDSAPVLERALAEKSGIGWVGKNTMILNRHAGSWFFLAEIFTDLPLAIDQPVSSHCGSCTACMDICPTKAFVGEKILDARKCISYLTIELKNSIPEELRPLMGNRVFGCDDCQLVCPWNRYAKHSPENDFSPRNKLNDIELVELFSWSEAEFLNNTEGSAIRRIGYERWLRNLAVGLGNAPSSELIIKTLETKKDYPSELVKEHVIWALKKHAKKNNSKFSI